MEGMRPGLVLLGWSALPERHNQVRSDRHASSGCRTRWVAEMAKLSSSSRSTVLVDHVLPCRGRLFGGPGASESWKASVTRRNMFILGEGGRGV